jgi:hypothetical protein
MRQSPYLQRIIRPLVEYRFLLSLGLCASCGIVLNSMFPINVANPLLRLIALERPPVFHGLIWSYNLFLYSTPFLVFSMVFSLLYVHLFRTESELAAGALPPYPDPHTRTELSLVIGEIHRQLVPKPSPAPQWLSIPERGLYTGIASFGSIGSGKTYGLVLPAMRQLFAYQANDPARRLSSIALEAKGDLCRQLQRILKWCGREQDYVEVSLDGDTPLQPVEQLARSLRPGFQHRFHHLDMGQGQGTVLAAVLHCSTAYATDTSPWSIFSAPHQRGQARRDADRSRVAF